MGPGKQALLSVQPAQEDRSQSWQPGLLLDRRSLKDKRRNDVSDSTSEKTNKCMSCCHGLTIFS